MNIRKITFFDIETVGRTASYDDLAIDSPKLHKLWAAWQDKYKEANGDKSLNELWVEKAGLHPEYGKIICVSFGYFDADMNHKIQSFYGADERDILEKTKVVLNNTDKVGFSLSGHTIKRFDCPYLWKRFLALGIVPPTIINVWDKKPWELKYFDIAEVWGGGSWKESFTSLDTMCATFDVESPKQGIKGNMVHSAYWNNNAIEEIKTYCEGDVRATMDLGNKLVSLIY